MVGTLHDPLCMSCLIPIVNGIKSDILINSINMIGCSWRVYIKTIDYPLHYRSASIDLVYPLLWITLYFVESHLADVIQQNLQGNGITCLQQTIVVRRIKQMNKKNYYRIVCMLKEKHLAGQRASASIWFMGLHHWNHKSFQHKNIR